jgi:hypothetical protein
LELLEEHPLLWEHMYTQSDLYFSKAATNPFELFVSIYQVHSKTTKDWIPFEKFINSGLTFLDLCKSTNALFAKGPTKLLEAYSVELDKFGMQANIFGKRNPKRWKIDQWVEESDPLSVLIIGKSYVVAESFDFTRV